MVCVVGVACGWTVPSAVSENSNDGLGPEDQRERAARVSPRGPATEGPGRTDAVPHATGPDKTRQDKTGQDRTGQDRTGQDRTRTTWQHGSMAAWQQGSRALAVACPLALVHRAANLVLLLGSLQAIIIP